MAVSVHRDQLDWPLGIPLVVCDEPILATRNYPLKYVHEMARIRNMAMEKALAEYPETEHVFWVDGYYVEQPAPLNQLLRDYFSMSEPCFLGGALWTLNRVTFPQVFQYQIKWGDSWSVPDCADTVYSLDKPRFKTVKHPLGFRKVSSVGRVFLFPRSVWDQGIRFGSYVDLHGCEFNYFCEHSSLPKFVDFNAAFFRETVYPVLKGLRVSLHLGRFKFWKGGNH